MINRQIEPLIRKRLKEYPALVISGPRGSGKTTLLKKMFPEFSYADFDDEDTKNLARLDPAAFFKKHPMPVIIDEVQNAPAILSQVQFLIDENRDAVGQFVIICNGDYILKKTIKESLAGRVSLINMLPLSLLELSNSGKVLDLDEQLFRGLMPCLFNIPSASATEYYEGYIRTVVLKDILHDGYISNLTSFINFLPLLARRTACLTNYSVLGKEVGRWIALLEAAGLVFRLPPFFSASSPSSQLGKTPKLYFNDTGLAAYLMRLRHPEDISVSGFKDALFENLVVLEALKAIRNTAADGRLSFCQDHTLVHHISQVNELYTIKYADSPMAITHCEPDLKSSYAVDYINYLNIGKCFERRQEEFRLEF